MFNINDLKPVKVLSDFSESMLHKIMPITVLRHFDQNHSIFKEGEYAEHLFAVSVGKVSLEIDVHTDTPVRVKDILPGMSFGISSVVDTVRRTYISNARTLQESSVFCWKNNDLEKLFYSDYEFGFLFMRNIGRILKNRLQIKRAQLGQELYAAHM